jgi:hypothetical protein
VGFYDPDYHVNHYWNDHEDVVYRGYLAQRHEDYREFSKLKPEEQRTYWQWRHSHSDPGG